jgi:hypothetical protein
MLENLVDWIRLKWHMWNHRNDTKAQKAEYYQQAKRDLAIAVAAVKEQYSNEPATKEIHEVFDSLDNLVLELELEM